MDFIKIFHIYYITIKKVDKNKNLWINKFFNVIYKYNNYFYECLPGCTKYFNDLGFNVEVLI